ncbi:hypothetical protein R1sor_008840 [Riccia sorocarpa]|uniref:Plant heme peroxidase family profile domain-containing protein n=1 Tax=Riccia sorocarpa TaxID=122646 RepID=A0ABD3H656_9MARC
MEAKRLSLRFKASGRMRRTAFPDGSPECCVGYDPTSDFPLLALGSGSFLDLLKREKTHTGWFSGAHTIGLTHCAILTPRLYNSPDPTLNSTFVTAQKAACPKIQSGVTRKPLDLDFNSGKTFDITYYKNIL